MLSRQNYPMEPCTAGWDFHPIKLRIFQDFIQTFTRFCTDLLRLSDEVLFLSSNIALGQGFDAIDY